MSSLLNDFGLVALVIVGLYIWFDTDAFPEWASLFRLKFLKYQEYWDAKKTALSQVSAKTYTDFIRFKYLKSFVIRLITCPICSSTVVNTILWLFLSNKIGGWWVLGFNILVSWLGYFAVRKAILKLNE